MIVHDLQCRRGHRFEAWFKNFETFEKQRRQKQIECPECGSSRIDLIYRANGIRARSLVDPDRPASSSVSQRLAEYLEKNFEDVGENFAEEARRVHYGEAESRNIRGQTTEVEEKELQSEQIGFFKVQLPKPTQ